LTRSRSIVGRAQRGFTLAELAVVCTIIALLIGGTLFTLAAQNAAREISETQRTLDLARDAITGFAIRYGRLPCPAAPKGSVAYRVTGEPVDDGKGEEGFASSDKDVNATNGQCFARQGLVPALTLGIATTDADGYLVDAWLNRVRYAVSQMNYDNSGPPPLTIAHPFTAQNGLRRVAVLQTPYDPIVPDLQIKSGTVTFNAPAVVYSIGKNRSAAGVGVDEQENGNGDSIFVFHEPRPSGAVGGEYDDIVTWISLNVLYQRLIAAGAL